MASVTSVQVISLNFALLVLHDSHLQDQLLFPRSVSHSSNLEGSWLFKIVYLIIASWLGLFAFGWHTICLCIVALLPL